MTSRPLRILLLAPTGFFADYGCHVRIRGHATALVRAGHDVLICTYPGGREVTGLTTVRPPMWSQGREMPVGSSWKKLLLDATLAPTAFFSAIRFKPHLIHAYLHEGALVGRMLAKVLGIPLVFDYQGSLTAEMVDHGFLSCQSPLFKPIRWLEQRINSWPDAVLASSGHAAGILAGEHGLSSQRVHTLPDSVDSSAFRPLEPHDTESAGKLRGELSIPPGTDLIVYLGLLAEYQGTSLLLHAMRRLVDRVTASGGPCPHLLIMGFPSLDRYRRLAAELGLSGDVTFTGRIAYEDAPAYLRMGTIAVATKISATEGSGKILNYMATALPVAAFDTPVHREYLQDQAAYADPGDVQGLADAMASLLEEPSMAEEQGAVLRRRAVASYSWDAACATMEQVYRELL